jgi:hypothetical protein
LITYYPAEFKIVRQIDVRKIRMNLVSVVCRPAGHKNIHAYKQIVRHAFI